MKIRQFTSNDIWIFDNDDNVIKHLDYKEAAIYHQTTQKWFADLLQKYKNDTAFITESDLFDIEEKAAMKALNLTHTGESQKEGIL